MKQAVFGITCTLISVQILNFITQNRANIHRWDKKTITSIRILAAITILTSAVMPAKGWFSCSVMIHILKYFYSWVLRVLMRYQGVYLKTHRIFHCVMIMLNGHFIRHSTPYLVKLAVWRHAQLLKQNLYLFYGLDACPLNRDQVTSLEFAVNSCFRKIFCVTRYITNRDWRVQNVVQLPLHLWDHENKEI